MNLVDADIIGSDLGRKPTPIGSLATLLWMDAPRRRGASIGWQYYLRVGLLITPPVLPAALLALAYGG